MTQLKVLAVDDENSQLQDLARLLRSSSIVGAVECASDGHDALVKASGERYDVIFLDVRMPGLDGVELGRVLRRFAAPPQLVFVIAYARPPKQPPFPTTTGGGGRGGSSRPPRRYVPIPTRAVGPGPQLAGPAELAFADGQTIPAARRHVAELGRLLAV